MGETQNFKCNGIWMMLILVMILLMVDTTDASYVYLNGSAVFVRTPYLHKTSLPPPFNVTSFLIPLGFNASGLQNCKKPDASLAPFMKGAIVFVAPDGGCSINQHALVAQNAGAAAVMFITYGTYLFAANLQGNPSTKVLKVPVIFIEGKDFNKYIVPELSKGGNVIMKVEGDKSEMDLLNKGGIIFYQIILAAINLAGLILMIVQLVRFALADGIKISVANGVMLLDGIACFFCLLYLFDPWSYWHAIANFYYLVVNTNLLDYFSTMSLLMVSFHLSRVVLKRTLYKKYVFIAYGGAIFLMIGYTVVLIISLSFNLTYSIGKLSTNSIEKFRMSVYALIAFYIFCCTLYFIKRLVGMWDVSKQTKQTKRIQYKRLVFSTFGIWFFVITSIVFRGLFLHEEYDFLAVAVMSIEGAAMITAPGLALCYFFLFKARGKDDSTNSSKNNTEMNTEERYKKFDSK